MVAGDELGFGLGEVEGSAVGLGVGGHDVDEEGDELEAAEEVPGEQAVGALTVDDVADCKLTEIPLSQALTCRLFGSRREFGAFHCPDNNESRLNLRLTMDHYYL